MGVGLKPLEFTDCLTDSPYFRENLHYHERELENTSTQIKRLIKEVKDLLTAAKNLSRAQRAFSKTLQNFSFECIGETQTEDEIHISQSLKEFGKLIALIEDERDRMLANAYDQIILPLEQFRKTHIGGVKEGKKKFEKQTIKFCQSQERYLNLSTKKQDNVLQEADATLDMAERHFCQASLEYVFLLQEVQERKKFEFVETLLSFMLGWLTFYHQGHEVAKDFKPYMSELQLKIQKTRENFHATRDKTESLMNKMKDVKKSAIESGPNKLYSREGYLYFMEKKAFGTTWTKQYCTYQKDKKEFTMIPYNQLTGKFSNKDTFTLASCVRRMSESIDKRFCFDITAVGRPGVVYTFQALSEDDRKAWMDAMDGREPVNFLSNPSKPEEKNVIDATGIYFITRCIKTLEERGLEEQGLYRVVGVSSKVNRLLSMGLDRRKFEKMNLESRIEWESKTITSALKTYLRSLSEPLMTYRLYENFLAAAKLDSNERLQELHRLVYRLPQPNLNLLLLLINHLHKVVKKSDKNLMTVGNLAVCFGPTLLRPEQETVASIMEIKFYNVVTEVLIENCERIIAGPPSLDASSPMKVGNASSPVASGTASSPGAAAQSLPSSPRSEDKEDMPPAKPQSLHHQPIKPKSPQQQGVTGNGAVHLPTYSVHTVVPATVQEIPRSFYESSLSIATKSPLIDGDQKNNGEVYQDTDNASHRLPMMFADSHISRLKHRNTNFMYHSADRVSTGGGNTSSSSESIASDPPPYLSSSGVPVKQKRDSGLVNTYFNYPTRSNPIMTLVNTSPNSGRSSPGPIWRVRTLYACMAESVGELSFEPNQIITNVQPSSEPGWLVGTLNGKTGLIPKNYVEQLP
ncbi:rho GTPase-activating protein 10-like [Trichogramma pretiosum]|uniref:rho GTPase-activating protein 10-like n=1 Tax=Trichogramma pretiosum TaxID=7493 RepID=UPI0006C9C97A|nr:rho GTPase-activating protein 10-like [Trichogramma pretiosum]